MVSGECVFEFNEPIDKLRYPFQNEERDQVQIKCEQLVEMQSIENEERTLKSVIAYINGVSITNYENRSVNGECVFEFNQPIDKLRYPFQNEEISELQGKCEQLVEMQSIENEERTLKSVTFWLPVEYLHLPEVGLGLK